MYSGDLLINEPLNPADEIRTLDQLCITASSCLDADHSSMVSQIATYCREIGSFAHEYDFEYVHANGFRSVLSLTRKILQRGLQNVCKGGRHEKQFTSLIRSMVSVIDCLKELREKTKSNGIPMTTDRKFFAAMMHSYVTSDFELHEPIYDTLASAAFGFTGNSLKGFMNFFLLLACCEPTTFAASLFNRKLWSQNLDKHIRNYDLLFLKLMDRLANTSFTRVLMKLYAYAVNMSVGVPPWPRTVCVPRQTKFMICVDPNNNQPLFDLKQDCDRPIWGSDPIQCLYSLKPHASLSGEPAPEALILDVHGGAFVSGCPEMHLMYCQRWAQLMPGVGVLQVRYPMCPDARFPAQIQILLDAYMWLISGDESVEEEIGFHPKKIILAGDSAGALFAMSLLVVLSEIRKRMHPQLRLPIALFGFYGAFSIVPQVTASSLTSPFHFFIFPNLLSSAARHYRPDIDNPSNGTIRKYTTSEIYQSLHNPQPSVFKKDENSIMQYLGNLEGITDHPFVSPMVYDDFESLSDVQLHCTSTHSEPILDSTIAMLKKWKGKASLSMMGNVVHGYMNSIGISRQHNQAFQHSVKKLRSVLQIPPPANQKYALISLKSLFLVAILISLLFLWFQIQ